MNIKMNINMNNIINISSDNITGKCDYKCSYIYDYLYTNLVAKNNTNMISIINEGIEPVVKYNNNNYMVSSTMLVSPSLHKFNNKKTDGEILIEHMPIQGGKKMYVCIPIIQSTNFSSASVTIALIIEAIKADKTAKDNIVRVKADNFTLNSFIPKGKFYSYNGNDLNGSDTDFVVFGIENAIPMNQTIFNSLTELILPISTQMKGGALFVNDKGPNSSDVITDISNLDISKLADNTSSAPFIDTEIISIIIQIILNCLFFFTLFYIINFSFNYMLSGVNNKIYVKT